MKTAPKPASQQKNASTKPSAESADISSMLCNGGRNFLLKLKQKSIRVNNSWYRLLAIDKRRLIDAVIQTVDKIRSSQLLKILTPLAGKLLQAIGGIRGLIGNLSYGMQNFGQPQAQRISIIAEKWGNNLAAKWASDDGFIRFLTVIDMNDLPIFKVSSKL
ncbi:MAG: hypothetical protein M1167_04540 [Chloroflexi bacterium]|nr:hypothetical protein [Chloroflexota bacterium]